MAMNLTISIMLGDVNQNVLHTHNLTLSSFSLWHLQGIDDFRSHSSRFVIA